MQTTSLSVLRSNTKKYFEAVRKGETIQVFKNGKPLAIITPWTPEMGTDLQANQPIILDSSSLSKLIQEEIEKINTQRV